MVGSLGWNPCLAAEQRRETRANVATEITFTARGNCPDPFNEISLDVLFTEPGGKILRVPAFWDGGEVWKVRYASPKVGLHQYRTECTTEKFGLSGITGSVKIVPYRGDNALFKHGPIRISEDHRHFEHGDGTPFFWLGDTWWMGLCHRLHWPDEFQTLTADRKAKGFNVIQIVAGLYPDMPPFDPRGANEAGFPWETNYARIRPEYFDAADRRLNHLVEQGFTPCLVGAWGYFLPWMGVEKAKQHWRYLIARYGAWPMVWCSAGEANLPYYLEKGFPFESREQVKGWSEVMKCIREIDPFQRPLSSHPTGLGRLSARAVVTDQALLDFDMLQTGHGLRGVLRPTVNTLRDSYGSQPMMPVLNSEVCFEQLGDSIPAEIPRLMFWASVLNGAAGHTYGANGIWQCNRPDQPHGASPHGGNYGKITWSEAMKLPGSRQVGEGKKFLEGLGWRRFEPQSQFVAWRDKRGPASWGEWIWFPEGDPKTDAPAETRYFRKTFTAPANAGLERAELFASADNKFEAWVNGKSVGSGADWHVPRQFEVGKLLKPGNNILAVRAENVPDRVNSNPASLIVTLKIALKNGSKQEVVSDATWRTSKTAPEGWANPGFDDAEWSQALTTAHYGEGPWGNLGGQEDFVVPFAAGVGETIRVIYAPDPRPIIAVRFRSNRTYRVTRFDPVTGERSRATDLTTGKRGELELPPPPMTEHDWVIALELR